MAQRLPTARDPKGCFVLWSRQLLPGKLLPTPLKGHLTTRRAHILHFVSYLALWALTIISAMRPNTWATRTSPRINTHSPLEIIWMIITSAAIIQVFQHPHHNRVGKHILLLPSALALITCWTTYGVTFLTASIPFLTISLIRPEPPSIPFLFPSLLPHSIRLWDVIIAGFTGWALISYFACYSVFHSMVISFEVSSLCPRYRVLIRRLKKGLHLTVLELRSSGLSSFWPIWQYAFLSPIWPIDQRDMLNARRIGSQNRRRKLELR